jgi:phage tail tape-measure protein
MRQGDVIFTRQSADGNPITCPMCDSARIETLNYAKKAGGTIGTVTGGAAGYVGAMSGAEVGTTVGLVAGPVGAVVGCLLGALFGAVVGASAGCAAGAKLGEVVDTNIMNNYHCLECDHTFSKQPD